MICRFEAESMKYAPYEARLTFLKLIDLNGKSVLDIGANKAKMSRILAKNFDCQITCIDPDPEKIEIAKQYAADDNLRDKIRFVKNDARKTDFRSEEFQVSLCYSLLHHIENIDRSEVIDELARITSEIVMIADLNESGAKFYDEFVHPDENHFALMVDFGKLEEQISHLFVKIEKIQDEMLNIYICRKS